MTAEKSSEHTGKSKSGILCRQRRAGSGDVGKRDARADQLLRVVRPIKIVEDDNVAQAIERGGLRRRVGRIAALGDRIRQEDVAVHVGREGAKIQDRAGVDIDQGAPVHPPAFSGKPEDEFGDNAPDPFAYFIAQRRDRERIGRRRVAQIVTVRGRGLAVARSGAIGRHGTEPRLRIIAKDVEATANQAERAPPGVRQPRVGRRFRPDQPGKEPGLRSVRSRVRSDRRPELPAALERLVSRRWANRRRNCSTASGDGISASIPRSVVSVAAIARHGACLRVTVMPDSHTGRLRKVWLNATVAVSKIAFSSRRRNSSPRGSGSRKQRGRAAPSKASDASAEAARAAAQIGQSGADRAGRIEYRIFVDMRDGATTVGFRRAPKLPLAAGHSSSASRSAFPARRATVYNAAGPPGRTPPLSHSAGGDSFHEEMKAIPVNYFCKGEQKQEYYPLRPMIGSISVN